MEYIATNIRLPRQILDDLKVRAAKEHKSLAQLIREAIDQTFYSGSSSKQLDPRKDPFRKLIGAWASGVVDGAEHHDRDIYGARD